MNAKRNTIYFLITAISALVGCGGDAQPLAESRRVYSSAITAHVANAQHGGGGEGGAPAVHGEGGGGGSGGEPATAGMGCGLPVDEAGDCAAPVACVGGVVYLAEDLDDPYDDGNACTLDACEPGGVTSHTKGPAGAKCSDGAKGKKCSAGGVCLECLNGGDCDGGTSCQIGKCVGPVCQNIVMDAAETDVDCGGPDCAGCGVGKGCLVGGDCLSKVCASGVCLAPTCQDGERNGTETGIDCGGVCAPCA